MTPPLILPYDPDWSLSFARLAEVLGEALRELPVHVHHVGSTAVPGLAAKPIIDVDVETGVGLAFSVVRDRLRAIGYRHHGDQGIAGREVFKPVPEGGNCPDLVQGIPHHLYVCPAGSRELRRHLAFRDALRRDAHLRAEYADLKRDIARRSGQNRKKYAEMKEELARPFVERALRMKP